MKKLFVLLLTLSCFVSLVTHSATPKINSQSIDTTSNLQGWWKLDDGSGSSATDSSGNGNTGTLQNSPAWSSTQVAPIISVSNPYSLNLTASNHSVSIPHASSIDNTFDSGGTVMGWILVRSGSLSSGSRFMDKRNSAGTTGWVITADNIGSSTHVEYSFGHIFSSTNGVWTSKAIYPFNTWTHVAVTYNNSSVTNVPHMYINGIEVSFASSTTPVGTRTTDSAEALNLGNNVSSSLIRALDGQLDDMRVYKRILNADEIKEIADATVGRENWGWYKFDDGSGSTAINSNYSGFNDATLVNSPTWDSSVKPTLLYSNPYSLSFNGTNQHLTINQSNTMAQHTGSTGTMSICAWVNPTNFTNIGSIVTRYETTGNQREFAFGILNGGDAGKIRFFTTDQTATTYDSTKSTNTLTSGVWSHVCTTYDASLVGATNRIKLYINGVQEVGVRDINAGTFGSMTSGTGKTIIGAQGPVATPVNYFVGNMDEVRFFNRVITLQEIKNLAAGGDLHVTKYSGSGSLIAYYPLEENTGTFSQDKTPYGFDMVFNGSPTWTTGIFGHALSFSTTTSQYTTANQNPLVYSLTSFTHSIWIKVTANPSSSTRVFPFIFSGTGGGAQYFELNNGVSSRTGFGYVSWYTNAAFDSNSVGSLPTVGRWYNLTAVRDTAANKLYLYIDGVLNGSGTTLTASTAAYGTGTLTTTLGGFSGVAACNCVVDDARVYSRAMSAAEVKALFMAKKIGAQ